MDKLIFNNLMIALLVTSCQLAKSVPEQPKISEEKIVEIAQDESAKAVSSMKSEILESIKQTIRNEIVPEVREISLLSRKVRKKQSKARGEALSKTIIGRVEWISTTNPKVAFRARVDTGAQTCSMHAESIVEKEKNGKNYVEFATVDDDGNKYVFLKEIVKETKVKSTSGKSEKRFVVKMSLSFGGKEIIANVNLNDRSSLKHNFLIGRNLLMGDYIVDVSQSRLMEEN